LRRICTDSGQAGEEIALELEDPMLVLDPARSGFDTGAIVGVVRVV